MYVQATLVKIQSATSMKQISKRGYLYVHKFSTADAIRPDVVAPVTLLLAAVEAGRNSCTTTSRITCRTGDLPCESCGMIRDREGEGEARCCVSCARNRITAIVKQLGMGLYTTSFCIDLSSRFASQSGSIVGT